MQLVGSAAVRVGLSCDVGALIDRLNNLPDHIRYIEVEHRRMSSSDANLIRIAFGNSDYRPLVEWFAIHGWFMYKSDGAISSLVRYDEISSLWHQISSGNYKTDSFGTVYSVNDDNVIDRASSLIVVFSSMSLPFDGSGLSRYFEQNFSSINRHVGSGSVVLRIADIDGVVGGFYSPTRLVPDRIDRVQHLIECLAEEYDIDPDRVILYGGSKGGTGALLHALHNSDGWRCVAVDPVVDDSYYESTFGDSHWTGGRIFLQRKVDLFENAVTQVVSGSIGARFAVVTSPRSPLFSSVKSLAEQIPSDDLVFAVSDDSRIRDHPDVSRCTLRFVTGLLNVWASGVRVAGQEISIG